MRLDVMTVPGQLSPEAEAGAVVVIDVFRATTTIVTALANGARFVLPAADVEQAIRLYEPYDDSEAILGGEREGVKIQGFHLGNSPAEYSPERVSDRVVVFTTTNGTKALIACRNAEKVFLGCFLNLSRLAEELRSEQTVTVVCAGANGGMSLEDMVCAGGIVAKLAPRAGDLSDSAMAARLLFRSVRTRLAEFLYSSGHARELARLGFKSDIEQALRLDSVPVLPHFSENRVRLGAEPS